MTSFMMPHVYGRLMPEHLNLVITNGYLKPKINYTLANYLFTSLKASEQYSEIWESMCKITNMYELLGDNPIKDYEFQEMFNVFRLTNENTTTVSSQSELLDDRTMIHSVITSISSTKKSGNSVIKVGDLFSQVAIDCIYMLSLCFNEVYIYKPASNPAVSNEKYVVCKDFKLLNIDYLKNAFAQILNLLEIAKTVNCLSLYTRRINNNYMNTLIEANSVIGQQQLEAINNTITLIEQGKKKERIEALKRQQIVRCSEWNKRFGSIFSQNKQESVF